jgi:hypothetical protein
MVVLKIASVEEKFIPIAISHVLLCERGTENFEN